MKVITLLAEKGGVGKTTLASYIAVGLSLLGYRVLFIDSDAQGNGTSALGLQKEPCFYDLLVRNADWKQVLRRVPADTIGQDAMLFAVPSNFETSGVAGRIKSSIVAKRLSQIRNIFDFCIIDTQPNPTMLHDAIGYASNYLILPTDCEAFSAWEGLPDTIEHTQRVREDALKAGLDVSKIIGIIPNKKRNTTLHEKFVEDLIANYGDLVWDAIPMRTAISDSQAFKEFLYNSEPDMDTTSILWQVVNKVVALSGVVNEQG